MANRLSKIYTRTGDKGSTGLGDGTRVAKDSLRVQAMGDVDELNSQLGLLLCEALPDAVHTGAGFADVKRYQKLTPDKYPVAYEQTMWGFYDVPDYARNFMNVSGRIPRAPCGPRQR